MLIQKSSEFKYSDITPKEAYLNRRRFLGGAAVAGAAALAGRGIAGMAFPGTSAYAAAKFSNVAKSSFSTTEKPNTFDDVSHYNNYYEFGTGKDEPVVKAKNFKTDPWVVSVEGLVGKPQKLSMDDILKIAPLEERIYRHRCVEAWSIVVPWIGYSLGEIVRRAEPQPKAKFVVFESFFDLKQMPMSRFAGIDFPYREGLRLDEAMNPLALLTVGMYGETLPPQNGAPVRLVLPWKYGFKSIKSIIKIKLVDYQPPNSWNLAIPNEYGFYANVNPAVDHPRWSQAKERRLGEFLRRATQPFNGYADQVASMYSGMDLRKNY